MAIPIGTLLVKSAFFIRSVIMKKAKKAYPFRHLVFWHLLRPLVAVFLRIKFGYTFKKAKNLPENYIVLSNHVTDFDPLFVGVSFRRQMYLVASEHISRWRVAYPLLKYAFAPIIRHKGSIAASTVMEIMRATKKGKSVCIFAEGVRTWDGITGPILPSTAALVKAAKCGLVTYKITGGYFVSPNWSQGGTRRGPISGAPVHVFTKEQIAKMSEEEIYEIITTDLYEDAYERQLAAPKQYKGKRIAEKLENLLFLCPFCGKHDTLKSVKDTVTCTDCGNSFQYDTYGMLHGIPHKTVREAALWQQQQVEADCRNDATYTASNARISCIDKGEASVIAEGPLSLTETALLCGDVNIATADIPDLAIHGRHELVFTANEKYYEIHIPNGGNALKFLLFFRECKKHTKEKVK